MVFKYSRSDEVRPDCDTGFKSVVGATTIAEVEAADLRDSHNIIVSLENLVRTTNIHLNESSDSKLSTFENFGKSIIWQCVRVVKESDSKSDRLACVGSNPTTVVFL